MYEGYFLFWLSIYRCFGKTNGNFLKNGNILSFQAPFPIYLKPNQDLCSSTILKNVLKKHLKLTQLLVGQIIPSKVVLPSNVHNIGDREEST